MRGPTVDHFSPVSLDDLNASAEMLTRVDRKYVLSLDRVSDLLAELPASVGVLEIEGQRRFDYETIYFDTPDLLCFAMSARGRPQRLKVRTRSYTQSRTSFVEVKTRGRHRETVKDRIGCQWTTRGRLTADGIAFAGTGLEAVGQHPEVAASLTVAVTTRYVRTTLLAPDGKGRITVDTECSWMLPDGSSLAPRGLAIVETKSASTATDVDRLLWSRRCRPQSVSKFATGLAALRPELPHNRWARLLRGQLTPDRLEPLCTAV